MKLYTSSFHKNMGHPHAVSIARYPPRTFFGTCLPCLAPAQALLTAYRDGRADKRTYTKRFARQLSRLRFPEVIDRLRDGDVLLCYEVPGQFCHRHLVADWLREHGIRVEELP